MPSYAYVYTYGNIYAYAFGNIYAYAYGNIYAYAFGNVYAYAYAYNFGNSDTDTMQCSLFMHASVSVY